MTNRSVPVNTVLPHVEYQNVAEALDWLQRAFGFVEHYHYGDPISGAQVHLENAYLMVHATKPPGSSSAAQQGHRSQTLTIFVDDVDAHYERTKAAGAKIVEELHETIYGERQYGVEDFEGHRWLFSRHARDVDPAEWGAVVVER